MIQLRTWMSDQTSVSESRDKTVYVCLKSHDRLTGVDVDGAASPEVRWSVTRYGCGMMLRLLVLGTRGSWVVVDGDPLHRCLRVDGVE